MKKIELLLALTFLVIATQCTSESTKMEDKKEVAVQTEVQTLGLNGDEPWKVNPEMMVHLNLIEEEVNAFQAQDSLSYNVLGNSLKGHLKNLISSCTMKGAAHDELHVWLMPFMSHVNTLIAANTPKEQTEVYEQIKADLKEFSIYFN